MNAEPIHTALYAVHRAIHFDAIVQLNVAIERLGEFERSRETRIAADEYMRALKDVREGLEAAADKAAAARNAMFHKWGCDGSCEAQL